MSDDEKSEGKMSRSEDSLSISLPDNDNKNSSEAISEHILTNNETSGSFEEDRSLQEIEILNTSLLDNIDGNKQGALIENTLPNESSVISLNYLKNFERDSSKEESFNLFANVDLDDKSLSNVRRISDYSLSEKDLHATNFGLNTEYKEIDKRIKDFEELIAIKDSTIAALTSELDSIKESSNPNTGSTFSTTEYKQLQDEWQSRLADFNSAIINKNDLIQQLTESLEQSVKERKELIDQIDEYKNVIEGLQLKIQQLEVNKVVELTIPDDKFSTEYLLLEKTLNSEQLKLLSDLGSKFNHILNEEVCKNQQMHEKELSKLKENTLREKNELETEIKQLKLYIENLQETSPDFTDIKKELQSKHSQEMEELRTYFEKKCSDLEKNFSEEIFSQHSRKLSSSSSESELNSDLSLSNHEEVNKFNLNKKDVINLQNELNSLINKINKCDLDAMNDEDFSNLQSDLSHSNLKHLFKFDFAPIKNVDIEETNNYDKIKHQYEEKIKNITIQYEKEIDTLQNKLEELQHHNLQTSTVQEVGSSGEFEIHEVIQSYERRLQEQVTLAKLDIISALELQIQQLASSDIDTEEWPRELLTLREKFTDKYEKEIKHLKDEHEKEINRLKDEHQKVLNGALERARRRSLKEDDLNSLSKEERLLKDLLKERDTLKHQVSSLRNLLGELVKYFSQCEDELNNTIVDELVRCGLDKSLSQIEDELNLTNSSPSSSSKTNDSTVVVTRMHIIPNFNDLINIIENSSNESNGDSKDISIDLKNELEACLEKLKHEANAILTLTSNITKNAIEIGKDADTNVENKLQSLNRKLLVEVQQKEDLQLEIKEMQEYVESLEAEKDRLETELERIIAKDNVLEENLIECKNKIARFMESGQGDIVSEDYVGVKLPIHSLGDTMVILSNLQEKARNLLSESRSRNNADLNLIHLIEELSSISERIKDEAKTERIDLLKQIEVADKKYRTTQKFLEEQAMEREQERDEAQKRIDDLCNQLKGKEKDKVNCERISSEVKVSRSKPAPLRTLLQVERLEVQLQEKTAALNSATDKIKHLDAEKNDLLEKITFYRDIIKDLEQQTESKTKEIGQYLEAVKKLQLIVEQQDKTCDTLIGESTRDVSDIEELHKHIAHLENELQTLRIQNELVGNEGAKNQLYDIEQQLDKKTKELEALHSTGTNCSSPSEDISARDLVLPKSPNKMEDYEVPLQQIARLKEKLLRHSRAEDSAIKRIKDLEMQVYRFRQEIEEVTSERDCFKKQIQEQLVLISDFQIRLDEQRIRADNIEKQTHTSFELKIYDLQHEIASLREKLQHKEKIVNNQQVSLFETQERLKNLENELGTCKDDELVVSMQKEIEKLQEENARMKEKIKSDASMVPNLVENIISDKNSDMARLRTKLDDTEKLLEEYNSLKLDKKDLETLSALKSNGTSLEEVFSILNLSQIDQMRKDVTTNSNQSLYVPLIRKSEETLTEPEISAIVGPGCHFPLKNSTEISHSSKKVHFEDTDDEVNKLKVAVEEKDEVIKEYVKKLSDVESKISVLQSNLDDTEKTLSIVKETFEKELQELRDKEKNLGVELAEKKIQIDGHQKRIDVLEADSKRKDEAYKNLTKEKNQLEKENVILKEDNYKTVENVIKIKNKEIDDLKSKYQNDDKLQQKDEEISQMQDRVQQKDEEISLLIKKNNRIESNLIEYQTKIDKLENTIKENNCEIQKLNKDVQNKVTQIESLTNEVTALKEKLNKKRKGLKEIQDRVETQKRSLDSLMEKEKKHKDTLLDKDALIDVLNEDLDRYQNDIGILESELKKLKETNSVDLNNKIGELTKERDHLTDLLNEKEKIITQMAEDSHQLHVNLMTIKGKIREPGNILDLGTKLRDEQRKTAELMQEVHNLKAQLMQYKGNNEMSSSVDKITDQLRQELHDSNVLDSNILSVVSDYNLNSLGDVKDRDERERALLKEKMNKQELIQYISKLQSKILTLHNDFEKQQALLTQTKSEDSECIKQLRIQLDECLDSEAAIKKELNAKNVEIKNLEKELDSLKAKESNSKSESTQYKQIPSKESIELKQLREDYEELDIDKTRLQFELIKITQQKLEAENCYKNTKDLLTKETQKRKNLEENLKVLEKREQELRDALSKKNSELERTERNLEMLNRKLKNPFAVPAQTTSVPDEFLDKIKELNTALIDNKRFMDLIAKLTKEKKQLETEVEALKVSKRNDYANMASNELIARADYLFAKTLKLESIKKALVFQKRYLMQYLLSHKRDCPVNVLPDPVVQRVHFRREYTLKNRFRSVAFVLISVFRMKFLVRRWHSGVRLAEKMNSRHYKNKSQLQFQVGLPVSNQFFVNQQVNTPTNPFIEINESVESTDREMEKEGGPWSGNTPPIKEHKTKRPLYFHQEPVDPLRAPHLLAQFAERFNQIQEKLSGLDPNQ